jgi:hypothetical protein
MLCACVQFQHYSWHCFGIIVALQNLVKIKGVPSGDRQEYEERCSLTFFE